MASGAGTLWVRGQSAGRNLRCQLRHKDALRPWLGLAHMPMAGEQRVGEEGAGLGLDGDDARLRREALQRRRHARADSSAASPTSLPPGPTPQPTPAPTKLMVRPRRWRSRLLLLVAAITPVVDAGAAVEPAEAEWKRRYRRKRLEQPRRQADEAMLRRHGRHGRLRGAAHFSRRAAPLAARRPRVRTSELDERRSGARGRIIAR